MSYAIFRTQKIKSTVLDKCQRHNQRENKNYSNKDIDFNRTNLNYDLHNKQNIVYIDEINKKIKERYTGKKAIRKDAVLNVECLITSDPDFFKTIGSDETKRFFRESYEFVKTEFGKENIIYANVHMDETTPHMHLGFTPITSDGRLSAKEWLDGKKKLTELQDKFFSYVTSKGFDLDRGVSSKETGAKNIKIQSLKKKSLKELNEINRYLDDKRDEYEKVTKILYKNSLDISQINAIKCEDASTLFKKDIEHVKIKKDDFEKLRKSAIKAYEQHNLYATVSEQLKSKEKLKDIYKNESEEYRKNWQREIRSKDNSIHELKQLHKKELDMYKRELNYFRKFLSEYKIGLAFEKFKEKEKEKEKSKTKARNKSYDLEL
ncbi:MobV family relaxase [Paraclostridium sordellii]|uniref:MobV family relaxase n=1 Tax=Paraclostridium sordellii TaxID=1505 RepID=UPI001FAA7469|nr:MobV family relaxase [Paeniclostridium sordellii]